jgi:beta-1,4-N-acetylglucosaminyltransferase
MRCCVPLVVVPNPTLMNNHQAELAAECETQNWAVYGKLGYVLFLSMLCLLVSAFDDSPPLNVSHLTHSTLADAIQRSDERVREGGLQTALAPFAPPPFPVPEAERLAVFDWMVLTCYPRGV